MPSGSVTLLQRGLGIAAEDRSRARSPRLHGDEASTGPRHRCRGSELATGQAMNTRTLLQRGLGIAAEDRTCSPSSGAVTTSLQRGLGIAAEDRCASAVTPGIRTPLQRGLGIAAEDRQWPSILSTLGNGFNGASASLPRIARARWAAASRRTCFNGASASLPRIVASSEEVEQHQLQLQRGLGIAAEDRGQLERDHRGARRASTGPRHRCRGS